MQLLNKDELYEILTNPTRENFRVLLQNHLGEEDYLDFKKEWPDKEKEARHILAMANSGGGCIVFGVTQNEDGTFDISGLDKFKDAANLRNEVKGYLPASLSYYIKDFSYDNSEYDKMIGKKFQILIVEDKPLDLPYVCCKDGEKIKDGDIFIRKGTESEKANNYDIDKLVVRKIRETKIPRNINLSLEKHLEQLKTLYSELTYTTSENSLVDGVFKGLSKYFGTSTTYKKNCYPKEDYDAFVLRMLDKKKKRIEEELDI